MPYPIQIDPVDCGCTECGIGEYVPLNYVSYADVIRLLSGEASNATGLQLSDGLWDEIPKRVRKTVEWALVCTAADESLL